MTVSSICPNEKYADREKERYCPIPERSNLDDVRQRMDRKKDAEQSRKIWLRIFQLRLDIYGRVDSCPYLRVLQDTILEQSMFVYKYLNESLVRLAQQNFSGASMKRILKDALRGLAAPHDQNIVLNGNEASSVRGRLGDG